MRTHQCPAEPFQGDALPLCAASQVVSAAGQQLAYLADPSHGCQHVFESTWQDAVAALAEQQQQQQGAPQPGQKLGWLLRFHGCSAAQQCAAFRLKQNSPLMCS